MNSQFINHNGILYLILRNMHLHQFHDKNGTFLNDKLIAWKNWLGANHVLQFNEVYLFVSEVEEAVWEDLPQNIIEIEKIGVEV